MKRDITSGVVLLIISGILYSQTMETGKIIFEDDIDPMLYPKILLVLLGVLSVVIIIKALRTPARINLMPVFTGRTLSASAMLLFYAFSFKYLGFAVSSFVSAGAIAWIMGWRKPLSLLISIAVAVFMIWALFEKGLHIVLPAGSLFW